VLSRGSRLCVICIAGLGLVLGSCGSDNPGNSETDAAAEQEVIAAVDGFHSARDAEGFCSRLTEDGRDYVVENFGENIDECEQLFEGAEVGEDAEPPKVDPVGVEDDFALAIVQLGGEYDESLVYTLRRQDGEWLIDCPCVVPPPDEFVTDESASNDAEAYINSPQGLSAADQEETDGDFESARAVGDVALAYPSDGSVPTLLVRDGNGWRVAPIGLGAP